MPEVGLLARLMEALLNVVAPPSCAACASTAPVAHGFCAACGPPKRAPYTEIDGVPVVAAGLYEGSLVTAIRAFKYSRRAELASTLADLVRPHAGRLEVSADDAWVPVPLHPRRLAERGYNQSALLARELSRGTHARCLPRLLARTSDTLKQAALKRSERALNVSKAFSVRGRQRPQSVVLVDDVVTTGATVTACMHALAASGIRVLAVVAVARALPSAVGVGAPTNNKVGAGAPTDNKVE
jgi:ComF family protein